MDFSSVNRSIKEVIDFDVEKELYKFLKNQIPHIILGYNLEQLFIENVDNDGYILGFYSAATELINISKQAGTPFTMVEDGLFRSSIKIKINYRKINVYSIDTKLNNMLSSESYITHDFFGLTDYNLKKLNRDWIKPFILKNIIPTR